MSLSKENYDKLNVNYLYKKQAPARKGFYDDVYWCKNWTFRVRKYDDGRAYMVDTYWSDGNNNSYQVTDENIDDFEFIFDFREVMRIHDDNVNEYNQEDLYYAATNSGGYSCGGCYWVKKNTQKSLQLLIEKEEREIISLKSSLRSAENKLQNLLHKKNNPSCTCDPERVIWVGCQCKENQEAI